MERQATPSRLLNEALGGGLAYGRQILLYGSKAATKSSFCLQTIANAQRDGKMCAWIDSENSFDAAWAQRLGVNTDTLIVSRAHTINDVVDIGTSLMVAGVDLLVVDSVTACLPAVFFDKKDELKDLSDTKQMGSDARDWSHALKMLNYKNNNTLLILISQQRKALGSMFVKNIPTGGEAMRFYSSTIIHLISSESEAKAIKGIQRVNGRDIEEVVGRPITWTVEANKLGPSFRSGEYRFMFVGDSIGVDSDEELMSMAELRGLVNKSGSWYLLLDKKVIGRDNMINLLKTDEEFRSRVVASIDD